MDSDEFLSMLRFKKALIVGDVLYMISKTSSCIIAYKDGYINYAYLGEYYTKEIVASFFLETQNGIGFVPPIRVPRRLLGTFLKDAMEIFPKIEDRTTSKAVTRFLEEVWKVFKIKVVLGD